MGMRWLWEIPRWWLWPWTHPVPGAGLRNSYAGTRYGSSLVMGKRVGGDVLVAGAEAHTLAVWKLNMHPLI